MIRRRISASIIPVSIPFLELLQSRISLRSHWSRQVTERLVIGQIQFLGVIVCEDPGEHWILHQIIVAPPRQGVETHQILEVGDLSPHPALSH